MCKTDGNYTWNQLACLTYKTRLINRAFSNTLGNTSYQQFLQFC